MAAGAEVFGPVQVSRWGKFRDPRILSALATGRTANQHRARTRVVVAGVVAKKAADVDTVRRLVNCQVVGDVAIDATPRLDPVHSAARGDLAKEHVLPPC